jgi:hypothetical protein
MSEFRWPRGVRLLAAGVIGDTGHVVGVVGRAVSGARGGPDAGGAILALKLTLGLAALAWAVHLLAHCPIPDR